jgi:hypothetical protein
MYVIGQIAIIAGKDILTRPHGALVFGWRVRILAANLAKEFLSGLRCSILAPATASGMKSRHESGREQICAHH